MILEFSDTLLSFTLGGGGALVFDWLEGNIWAHWSNGNIKFDPQFPYRQQKIMSTCGRIFKASTYLEWPHTGERSGRMANTSTVYVTYGSKMSAAMPIWLLHQQTLTIQCQQWVHILNVYSRIQTAEYYTGKVYVHFWVCKTHTCQHQLSTHRCKYPQCLYRVSFHSQLAPAAMVNISQWSVGSFQHINFQRYQQLFSFNFWFSYPCSTQV